MHVLAGRSSGMRIDPHDMTSLGSTVIGGFGCQWVWKGSGSRSFSHAPMEHWKSGERRADQGVHQRAHVLELAGNQHICPSHGQTGQPDCPSNKGDFFHIVVLGPVAHSFNSRLFGQRYQYPIWSGAWHKPLKNKRYESHAKPVVAGV